MSGWIKGKKQREGSGPRCPHTEKLSAALTEGDAPHRVFIPDAVAAAGLVLGDTLFYMLSLIYSCTKERKKNIFCNISLLSQNPKGLTCDLRGVGHPAAKSPCFYDVYHQNNQGLDFLDSV